jgi:hypothetical protein
MEYGKYLLYAIIVIFVIASIFGKLLKNYHSHWSTLIDDFQFSTKEFYKLIEEELKSKDIKGIQFEEVRLYEGAHFSGVRLYLKITWKEFDFYICGAPFGKGFFVSYWLIYRHSGFQIILSKIPAVGHRLLKLLYPDTFYRYDTASMFIIYGDNVVKSVVDAIMKEKGMRLIPDEDRKPIMRKIFAR